MDPLAKYVCANFIAFLSRLEVVHHVHNTENTDVVISWGDHFYTPVSNIVFIQIIKQFHTVLIVILWNVHNKHILFSTTGIITVYIIVQHINRICTTRGKREISTLWMASMTFIKWHFTQYTFTATAIDDSRQINI